MNQIEDLYEIFLRCGGRVATDSRAISGGELFFALKGENFDGNEYALKALENGAGYAVVNEGCEAAVSGKEGVIPVSDTLMALKALARHHRNSLTVNGKRLPVIGLTGTNGKTTTKELLKRVLACRYKIAATEGNLNNDIGVPLTLLGIRQGTELAVVEMGANHPDDISHLTEVCEPDYGLITNVGKAHLLGFGSFEGVCRAKGQLYDWLQNHGGTAFVNEDQPTLVEMAAARSGMPLVSYGMNANDVRILDTDGDNAFLRLSVAGLKLETHLVGAYNATNIVAALAVGSYFGVPVADALEAIASFEPANKRSQMVRTASNILIVDAYNANPSSMSAALDNFAAIKAERKIALLGDMRELGADSLQEHVSVLEKLKDLSIKAMLVGEEFHKAMDKVGDRSYIEGWFGTSEELSSYLKSHILSSHTILIKGSRGIMMEKVTDSL